MATVIARIFDYSLDGVIADEGTGLSLEPVGPAS